MWFLDLLYTNIKKRKKRNQICSFVWWLLVFENPYSCTDIWPQYEEKIENREELEQNLKWFLPTLWRNLGKNRTCSYWLCFRLEFIGISDIIWLVCLTFGYYSCTLDLLGAGASSFNALFVVEENVYNRKCNPMCPYVTLKLNLSNLLAVRYGTSTILRLSYSHVFDSQCGQVWNIFNHQFCYEKTLICKRLYCTCSFHICFSPLLRRCGKGDKEDSNCKVLSKWLH